MVNNDDLFGGVVILKGEWLSLGHGLLSGMSQLRNYFPGKLCRSQQAARRDHLRQRNCSQYRYNCDYDEYFNDGPATVGAPAIVFRVHLFSVHWLNFFHWKMQLSSCSC
jgi:hypothetical protein